MALDAGTDYDRESWDYDRESSEPHQSLATTALDGRRRTDRQAAGLPEEMGRKIMWRLGSRHAHGGDELLRQLLSSPAGKT